MYINYFILSRRFCNSFISGACHAGRMTGLDGALDMGARVEDASNARMRASRAAIRSSSEDQ